MPFVNILVNVDLDDGKVQEVGKRSAPGHVFIYLYQDART